MKLSLKLPLTFAVAMSLLLAAALFGVGTLRQSLDTYSTTVAEITDHERRVADLNLHFKTQVQEWKNTLLRGRQAEARDKHRAAFLKLEAEVQRHAEELLQHMPPGEARALMEKFSAAHAQMRTSYLAGYDAFAKSGFDPVAGDAAVAGMDRAPTQLLVQAAEKVEALSKQIAADAEATGRRATAISLGVMLLMFGVGLAGAMLVSRRITRPLHRAVEAARDVADGNLAATVQATGRDEVAELLQALERMRLSLARVVADVRQNADGVATASTQIAEGNLDLSRRTEQQASALQQTAASMEELGATVRQNADNARQANELAQAATAVGVKGGEVVGQVVATMKGIHDSSDRIAEIIGTIDGIAFQTNILALNAAVEAARAGDHGRGFAVVAGEVRALAQRSAGAAREIKQLIGDSVGRVREGSALVDQAGATMNEIVASIGTVRTVVAEITAASSEQSAGVAQVGQAMSQIDEATQQNAALVEESTPAAARSMCWTGSSIFRFTRRATTSSA